MGGKKGPKSWRWSWRPQIDWPKAGRGLVVTGWAAAAAAAVCGWTWGVPRLEAYAATHQPPAPEGGVVVEFTEPPPWLDVELTEALRNAAAAHIGSDPMSQGDLADARQALLATGWMIDVRQVRRVEAHHVTIDADFARPLAVMRDASAGRDHLVDVQGRLLPRSYPAGQSGLVAVTGAQYGRPERPGLMWHGADVTAALKLLHLVVHRPWIGQVVAIDVTQHWRQGTLTIVTDQGCTIAWGREPGAEGGTEVPAEQKLAYLDYHFQEYGRIDRGLHALDITGDVVVGQ